MRVDMNIPVIGMSLVAAAVMQDLAPVSAVLPVKPIYLSAVALYVMLTRPVWVALPITLWAGGLTDALGGLPLLCTASFLLLSYGAVRLMQRVFLEASWLHGMLLTAVVAAAQMAWTVVWSGAIRPVFELSTFTVLGYALPAGLLAGLAVFALCGFVDRIAGIVKPTKEDHGILWAENNR
ncbi:MAG: hypothetical protein PHU80_06340 [Kiritimatiellae bacterium]|nr:hypothetical protein [Kiritimatiellia bacterium]